MIKWEVKVLHHRTVEMKTASGPVTGDEFETDVLPERHGGDESSFFTGLVNNSQTVSLSVSNWFLLSCLLLKQKAITDVFMKSDVSLISSCHKGHWGTHCFVTVNSGFSVPIWEERSARFTSESSVKRTGQLALCLVDSDSAQVCAPPAFLPSCLSTWYGGLWFRFRIWMSEVVQQFVSSSVRLYRVARSRRAYLNPSNSYGFLLQSFPLFLFSLLSFPPFLSFSLFLVLGPFPLNQS